MRPRRAMRLAIVLSILAAAPAAAQQPVQYRVSFPAPEHHYAQVEVIFAGVPSGTLEARMSRSSPGRYALHEFAKNVFDLHVFDGKGRALTVTRPNPYQWDVGGHDGTVRILYKVFGDLVDGTYLGIDASHAHMNMPAALMWARGFDGRPVRIRFEPPAGSRWKPATQLFPTEDPWTFTAPNLQYLMDSPTELSDYTLRSFQVRNPGGTALTIRMAVHHDATAAAIDEYAAETERIVREAGAVFGEFPEFDGGTYTFLGDYLPSVADDGMEHRNSTVVSERVSLGERTNVRRAMATVSHEFFHSWNAERIRPKSLEPFDFEEANMSGELWLVEGFTQYYGELIMVRAELSQMERWLEDAGAAVNVAVNSPARRFRSAVELSQYAPLSDAARSVDPTNSSYTFVSYYTYGAALAMALDLSLRDRSNGKVSLDDYMRAMWRAHGQPAGPQPGLVGKPYTSRDARDRLAEIADRAFADHFFDTYVEGRDAPDYVRLLARAGFVVRERNPGRAWIGLGTDCQSGATVSCLVPWGSPAFDAGLEQHDIIATFAGRPFTGLGDALKGRKPGEQVTIEFTRATGASVKTTIALREDPTLEAVTLESVGRAPTEEQRAFREGWLGPKRR